MANENIKIPKEHDLVKLYFMVDTVINLEENEVVLLKIATNYYKEDRYPNPYYSLPPREEIKVVLDFTTTLFDTICKKLSIDKNEITDAHKPAEHSLNSDLIEKVIK